MKLCLVASLVSLLAIWGGLKLGYGVEPHVTPCTLTAALSGSPDCEQRP